MKKLDKGKLGYSSNADLKLTNKRVNKMKALTILLLTLSFSATAGTAFLKYEYISGMNNICVYDYLGSDIAITIRSIDLCPLSISV